MIDMYNLLLVGIFLLIFSIVIDQCIRMPKVLCKLNTMLFMFSVMLICGASVNLMWVN